MRGWIGLSPYSAIRPYRLISQKASLAGYLRGHAQQRKFYVKLIEKSCSLPFISSASVIDIEFDLSFRALVQCSHVLAEVFSLPEDGLERGSILHRENGTVGNADVPIREVLILKTWKASIKGYVFFLEISCFKTPDGTYIKLIVLKMHNIIVVGLYRNPRFFDIFVWGGIS